MHRAGRDVGKVLQRHLFSLTGSVLETQCVLSGRLPEDDFNEEGSPGRFESERGLPRGAESPPRDDLGSFYT